jgi:hypothetical protein
MREKYTKKYKYDGFGSASMTLKYAAHYAKTNKFLSVIASCDAETYGSPFVLCSGVWNSKLLQALYA